MGTPEPNAWVKACEYSRPSPGISARLPQNQNPPADLASGPNVWRAGNPTDRHTQNPPLINQRVVGKGESHATAFPFSPDVRGVVTPRMLPALAHGKAAEGLPHSVRL